MTNGPDILLGLLATAERWLAVLHHLPETLTISVQIPTIIVLAGLIALWLWRARY